MKPSFHIHDRTDSGGSSLDLSAFPTPFGWFGVLGSGESLVGITIGHASKTAVRTAAEKRFCNLAVCRELCERDWHPDLCRRLTQYAEGQQVDFGDIEISLDHCSRFQRSVLLATRQIPHGQTRRYSDLAQQVGSPGAARAVGNVMASNRFPIVIPCHRVIAAGGRLGGFSAPQGTRLKERLLAMEANGESS